jgi:tetratricopeptide (TPR) repeat protein
VWKEWWVLMNAGNITLLKLADKLVREGHYAQALGAILRARREDPANRYAEAYEERVRALLHTPETDEGPGECEPTESQADTPLLTSIEEIVSLLGKANEALACDDFPGALELIGEARRLDPDDVDIKALEEHVRTTCSAAPIDITPGHEQEIIRGTIRAYEDEVYELAARGEYEESKELLSRALTLDPADNDLRACERLIHAAAKIDRQYAEVYMLAAQTVQRVEPVPSAGFEGTTVAEVHEAPAIISPTDVRVAPEVESPAGTHPVPQIESVSDPYQMRNVQSIADTLPTTGPKETDAVLAQDSPSTAAPAGEPARGQKSEPVPAMFQPAGTASNATRRAQIVRHANAARVLCNGGAYDEALTEIALGYILDPMDEGLHAIEESIWEAKASCTAADDSPRSSGDCSRRIRLQILAAEEFARSGEFTRALDGLAKAYVIDPANNELKRAEVRIRQQEIRHHQAATQPLILVYHHERVANAE